MKASKLKAKLADGSLDDALIRLYGDAALEKQKNRYAAAIDSFTGLFGDDRCLVLFSVPGRSEISGNHTDHNRGRVLAAAVDLDIIAVAAKRDDAAVTVKSEGFEPDTVTLGCEPDPAQFFTSSALIAGVADGLVKRGFKAGGFDAYTTSAVLKGSGLSSSAAFEVMIGTIQNHLYNDAVVTLPVIAEIAQYAENVYFGKPCGLMDQTACAVGGFIEIDFENPKAANIQKLPFDLTAAGYSLCITDTGGNHADLNEDYASVPAEMKKVAACFGRDALRGLTEQDIIDRMASLRETCGDRAVLRALHFIRENDRVLTQGEALKNGDLDGFLAGVLASGRSSFMWLQNCFTVKNIKEQGVTLALLMSEMLLSGQKAAWRVHGGGFAGTVQAFVPHAYVETYRAGMEAVFGKGSCTPLTIRQQGATLVIG